MRALIFLSLLGLACAGPDGSSGAAEGDAALTAERAGESVTETERALRETLERSLALADEIEDALRPVPLMRPGQEAELRRYGNAVHVRRARALGVQPEDDAHIERLRGEGRLVRLADSTEHWIVRELGASSPYVTPDAHALLVRIAEEFQERLSEMGLPPYRLEITSVLRTAAEQAALRRRNVNAATGTSAHEFGTTVDIAYSAYAPPAELPESLRVDAPASLEPYLRQVAAVALESVSARKSRELKAILGEVLREAQSEGIVLVTLENLQPVYHITVAEAIADE